MMMMGPRGFRAALKPAQPSGPPPYRLMVRDRDDEASSAKRRRSWWENLAVLDEKLGEVDAAVFSDQVGTLVVTVSQEAYDLARADTANYDRGLIVDVFQLLPGIYHKLGAIPIPPEEFGLDIKEPMPIYRQLADAHPDPGLFLYPIPNKGWFFSSLLNISSKLTYEESEVMAWSPPNDLNDNCWPSCNIHVPYYADKTFDVVNNISMGITVEPYTTWADRQIVNLTNEIEKTEGDAADAHANKKPPIAAKHGGFQEKTAKLISLYRKGLYTEFETFADELDNGGNFSRLIAKHMRA